MTKLYKLVALTVLLAFATPSIQAQETNIPNDINYSPAYQQTNQVALWSAYATITAFVVVAVFFGVADGKQSSDKSGSMDGLGSLGHSSKYRHGGYSH